MSDSTANEVTPTIQVTIRKASDVPLAERPNYIPGRKRNPDTKDEYYFRFAPMFPELRPGQTLRFELAEGSVDDAVVKMEEVYTSAPIGQFSAVTITEESGIQVASLGLLSSLSQYVEVLLVFKFEFSEGTSSRLFVDPPAVCLPPY